MQTSVADGDVLTLSDDQHSIRIRCLYLTLQSKKQSIVPLRYTSNLNDLRAHIHLISMPDMLIPYNIAGERKYGGELQYFNFR